MGLPSKSGKPVITQDTHFHTTCTFQLAKYTWQNWKRMNNGFKYEIKHLYTVIDKHFNNTFCMVSNINVNLQPVSLKYTVLIPDSSDMFCLISL